MRSVSTLTTTTGLTSAFAVALGLAFSAGIASVQAQSSSPQGFDVLAPRQIALSSNSRPTLEPLYDNSPQQIERIESAQLDSLLPRRQVQRIQVVRDAARNARIAQAQQAAANPLPVRALQTVQAAPTNFNAAAPTAAQPVFANNFNNNAQQPARSQPSSGLWGRIKNFFGAGQASAPAPVTVPTALPVQATPVQVAQPAPANTTTNAIDTSAAENLLASFIQNQQAQTAPAATQRLQPVQIAQAPAAPAAPNTESVPGMPGVVVRETPFTRVASAATPSTVAELPAFNLNGGQTNDVPQARLRPAGERITLETLPATAQRGIIEGPTLRADTSAPADDDLKDYMQASWTFLVAAQGELEDQIMDVAATSEDRGEYLTTGMGLIADEQDALAARVAALEAGGAGLTPQQLAELAALKETQTLQQQSIDDLTKGQQYMVRLLEDIVRNPEDYLFWNGYLADEGPKPLRFVEEAPVFDRANLIGLTQKEAEDTESGSEASAESELEIGSPQQVEWSPVRPAYLGNYSEVSAEDFMRMAEPSTTPNNAPVGFEVPFQEAPKPLLSPGSEALYLGE